MPYYVEAFKNKTKAHNREGAEYRKIPLHPFIVDKLREYITATGKGKNDYLFGKPIINADTGETDGEVARRLFGKAVLELYKRIKIKERLWETRDMMGALTAFDDKGLRKEMRENKISFYSMRHTFQTMLATKYPDKTLVVNYFSGHTPDKTMLNNYLHINKIDGALFWEGYGKLLVDFQAQFVPQGLSPQRGAENAIRTALAFKENSGLLNEDGTMPIEHVLEKVIAPQLAKLKNPVETVEDDFFDSV